MNTVPARMLPAVLLLGARTVFAACQPAAQAVQVNQVGFAVDGPKRAVVVIDSPTAVQWQLLDRDGRELASGPTRQFGADELSGQSVHAVDFTRYRGAGEGLRLRVACAESRPFDIAVRPWRPLAYDALAYFHHNRSGEALEARHVGAAWARPAGHEHERVTCRTGKDSQGNDWPGCAYELDVTGGWYDAGDQGKYVVNGGISLWTLLNLYERQQGAGVAPAFADGTANLPESGNGVNDLLDEARVEMEFLLRMQAPEGASASVPVGTPRSRAGLEFTTIDASGMAHHKVADINWTALPTLPHLDHEQRVLFPVSTAATLNLAATAAQCARIWKSIDAAFAARCLAAARRAYAAAIRNPAVYFIAGFSGSGMYGDANVSDEFFWAAAELAVSTGETVYFDALRQSPFLQEQIGAEPAWAGVAPLGWISLALARSLSPPDLGRQARERIVAAANGYLAESDATGYRLPYRGPFAWGSNSNVLNRAMLLALAWDFTRAPRYRDAVIDALDYLLGRNPLGQSYISGYGAQPLRNPHHRFWAHSLDATIPGPPPGALAGGPNAGAPADPVAVELKAAHCAPLTCWRDDVRAYSLNEVAINWNAPLVWVVAFADETFGGSRSR